MNPKDIEADLDHDIYLDWNADNSTYILHMLIPNLKLKPFEKQLMRWAYGADWEPNWVDSNGDSVPFEFLSDGETGVEDEYWNGKIKSPAGVAHDFGNRIVTKGVKHRLPSGEVIKMWKLNRSYRRIMKALPGSYGLVERWGRWFGVTLYTHWWK